MAEKIAGAAAIRPQAAATGREQGPTPGRRPRRRISILPAEKWRTGCRCFCSLLLCFPPLNFSKFFFSLVLDTFFFRLRGRGRGTHLGDPTQHRSNSGAGARISSKFFFSFFSDLLIQFLLVARIFLSFSSPRLSNFKSSSWSLIRPSLEAYFFFFDFRISSI